LARSSGDDGVCFVFEFLTGGASNGNGASETIDAPAGSVLVDTPGAVSIKEAPIGEGADRARGRTDARPRAGRRCGARLRPYRCRARAHQEGAEFDVIAGTSIGAMVGGCHAAGHLDAFEHWARSLTRRRVFGYLDFSLAGSGLIGGARLAERLNATLGNTTIDELPLRFAAIATEIGTGHEIWLTRGRLADALRASYSLPGVFAPVRVGGRWLMDGALVNPVPVSACRALGARVVVAVNLNADLIGRGATISSHGSDESDHAPIEVAPPQPGGLRAMFGPERSLRRQFLGAAGRPGFSTVMMEAFNIMQDRITRARLAGDPPDVIINPRLGGVGLIDFHRAGEAMELGAEATERALDSIGEAMAALA
jgi:NTE family protein